MWHWVLHPNVHTYPVGTGNCHIDIKCIVFHLSHFRTANRPGRKHMWLWCIYMSSKFIFYVHCNNIAQQDARLVLENVTIEYTQVHENRRIRHLNLVVEHFWKRWRLEYSEIAMLILQSHEVHVTFFHLEMLF